MVYAFCSVLDFFFVDLSCLVVPFCFLVFVAFGHLFMSHCVVVVVVVVVVGVGVSGLVLLLFFLFSIVFGTVALGWVVGVSLT